MSLALKLTISLICGLLGLVLVLFAVLFYWYKKQTKRSLSKSSPEDPFMKIAFGYLLKATDGLSSGNLTGIGSFGSIYKGVLEQDQTAVAVKVLNLQRKGVSRSFLAEKVKENVDPTLLSWHGNLYARLSNLKTWN
ncbi:hypothetical protein CRYUN_Cryun19dG0065500 [Craigia yunnanensis]